MNPLSRAVAVGLTALALAVGAVPVATSPVCAAQGAHAALVVDLGDEGGVFRYCVSLPDGEASGIELIELAHEQHGLSYKLGYGGGAVCMLAGVGPTGDDCFEDYPDFWGYWRGDGSGGWTWSSSGAGSTVVEDGDVEGWSWGSGNDGSSHPRPPETTFASVCGGDDDGPSESEPADDGSDDAGPTGRGRAPRPRAERERGDAGAARTEGDGGANPASDDTRDVDGPGRERDRVGRSERHLGKDRGREQDDSRSGEERSAPRPAGASASPADALDLARDDEPSPAGGAVAAAAATVLVVALGVFLARRRRIGPD